MLVYRRYDDEDQDRNKFSGKKLQIRDVYRGRDVNLPSYIRIQTC